VSITKDDNNGTDYQSSTMAPPIITRTAATPMATPQGSPNEAASNTKDLRNTLVVDRVFSISAVAAAKPFDKQATVRLNGGNTGKGTQILYSDRMASTQCG